MLIVFSGLPGVGKSTLARAVAQVLPACYLSVDPVEAALLRSGVEPSQPTGLAAYAVVEVIAEAQLSLGQTVLVDAVNAVEEARAAWRRLAEHPAHPLRIVECVCSDLTEHRRRVEDRPRSPDGFRAPTWADVQARRETFSPWQEERLVLEMGEALDRRVERVRAYLRTARDGVRAFQPLRQQACPSRR